jgi:hypothetical protein
MSRLIAPDGGVRGVDITTESGTRSYNPDRHGVITVENANHARQMKAEGFFEASLMGPTTRNDLLGFNCVECGFGSWFRVCSRCGHENGTPERDGE